MISVYQARQHEAQFLAAMALTRPLHAWEFKLAFGGYLYSVAREFPHGGTLGEERWWLGTLDATEENERYPDSHAFRVLMRACGLGERRSFPTHMQWPDEVLVLWLFKLELEAA